MNGIKTVAIGLALALLTAPVQVQARSNRTGLLIGAAVLGAALASSSSSHDRYRSRDRYRDSDRYYSYQPQYYRQSTYYVPADDYDSSLYRYNSGVGRDRLGTYSYDTGNMTQYGNGRYLDY